VHSGAAIAKAGILETQAGCSFGQKKNGQEEIPAVSLREVPTASFNQED